jgi:SHS2 domain-containing protein
VLIQQGSVFALKVSEPILLLIVGKYEFIPDIALADSAFKVEAETLEELFILSAQATFATMVDLKTVKPESKVELSLSAAKLDDLLFEWLAELIYLKDREAQLFSRFEVAISQNGDYRLAGAAWGDKIDFQRQELRTDVKAVTYHMFELRKTGNGYFARVVLDT